MCGVAPASRLRGGLYHLRCGTPTLLRRLAEVAGIELGAGLSQQLATSLAVCGYGCGQ